MGPYRYFHFLSLDIVLGVAASGYFASRILDVNTNAGWWLALCLSVWSLYLVDHWLDTRRHGNNSERPIHIFFRKNTNWLLVLILVISVADVPVIFFLLDRKLLVPGIVIGGVTSILYMFRHITLLKKRSLLPVEFFIMVVYTAGIWFGPLLMRDKELSWPSILIMLQFGLMILVNISVLSGYDYELDKSLNNISLATITGKKAAKILALISAAITVLISVPVILLRGGKVEIAGSLLMGFMAVITYLLTYYATELTKNEKYRMAADAILYLGWLIVLI